MLKSVSFNLSSIVNHLAIKTTSGVYVKVPVTDLIKSMYLYPIYPFCYTLDLDKFFDMKKHSTVKSIYFNFKVSDNIGVSLYLEDKLTQSNKRSLKSNMLSYVGPGLLVNDLKNGAFRKMMISFQQLINSEEDSSVNCTNYPNKKFISYEDCDRDYVYNTMKEKYGLVPFWTTNNMSEVTEQR